MAKSRALCSASRLREAVSEQLLYGLGQMHAECQKIQEGRKFQLEASVPRS